MTRGVLILLILALPACGDGLSEAPAADAQPLADVVPGTISNPAELPEELCNAVLQLGCDPGEKCSLERPEGGETVLACHSAGLQGPGQRCVQTWEGDDCREGLYCLGGSCERLCERSDQCSGGLCLDHDSGLVGLCRPLCDALEQDCPETAEGARQGCYLVGERAACMPIFNAPGNLPRQACSSLNDCAIGAGCVSVGGELECLAYCDFESNPNANDPHCSVEQKCRSLGGSATVGVCRP